jgi:hypothetical protein
VRFFLGTHQVAWLATADVPLMVSRNRLARRVSLPCASAPWVMDSGGFTELQQHGRWRITAEQYAAEVERYANGVGSLEWAAPQDWMCEPVVIHGGTFKGVTFAGTGLNVTEHQARTVGNYLDLMALGAPVIPVLQGHTLADYEACADRYAQAGVDLAALPVVGLGSICRRQNTDEIGEVVGAMAARGIRCHGFGAKAGAIRRYGALLASADSMAWSYGGRRRGTCAHLRSRCASCLHWALAWRDDVLANDHGDAVQMALPLEEITR